MLLKARWGLYQETDPSEVPKSGTFGRTFGDLYRDDCGATALEYGLILCMIVIVMVVGMTALGQETVGQWNFVSNQIASGVAQANS